MKPLIWIAAGFGAGLAAYWILTNAPVPAHSTGSTDVERAARKTAGWGAKQQVSGAGSSVLGKVKEGIGNFTGNDDLAGEGIGDQVAGTVKRAAGQVAEAAGKTLHDMNL
jgi:uncharacterized protein YjbJ (UPF0337 family)